MITKLQSFSDTKTNTITIVHINQLRKLKLHKKIVTLKLRSDKCDSNRFKQLSKVNFDKIIQL